MPGRVNTIFTTVQRSLMLCRSKYCNFNTRIFMFHFLPRYSETLCCNAVKFGNFTPRALGTFFTAFQRIIQAFGNLAAFLLIGTWRCHLLSCYSVSRSRSISKNNDGRKYFESNQINLRSRRYN